MTTDVERKEEGKKEGRKEGRKEGKKEERRERRKEGSRKEERSSNIYDLTSVFLCHLHQRIIVFSVLVLLCIAT